MKFQFEIWKLLIGRLKITETIRKEIQKEVEK